MERLLLLFDGIHLDGGIPMALFYAAFGFVFVFLGITLLVIIFSLLGSVMKSTNKKKKPSKKEPKAETIPQAAEEGISPETVAVITAAIASYMSKETSCDFVVRRIKRL